MKYLLLFILTLSINAQSSEFNKIAQSFKKLVKETNIWREDAIDFLIELNDNPDKIISSQELNQIHQDGTLKYKKLRDHFYKIINQIKYISELDPENITFDSTRSTSFSRPISFPYSVQIDDGNIFLMLARAIKNKAPNQNINLTTQKGKDFATLFKFAFASALILYDNYTLVIAKMNILKEKSKLDLIINYDNSKVDQFLKRVETEYSRISNYKAMKRSVEIYNKMRLYQNLAGYNFSSIENFAENAIQSSYIYSIKNQLSISSILKIRFKLIKKWIKNKIRFRQDETYNNISKIFGNTMGLVATRKGKLLKFSKDKFQAMIQKLKKSLRPMDILLEKTPFRLTDKFIPGHWGHVAVWLGTESELKQLGKWSDLPDKIKSEIRAGKNVLEALREGVVINSLERFMNVDDLAILRSNYIHPYYDYSSHIARSIQQYGKEYDFNFNVETDKTIVCSELVYTIFNNKELVWPLDKTLGRYTISPDNIAKKATYVAQRNSEFSFRPYALYLNGKEVLSHSIQNRFDQLLEK